MQGWIKLHRKLLNNPIFTNSEALHLWIYLLLNVNHQDNEFYFNMSKISVKKGQLITGRKKLAQETGINENKIRRILKLLKNDHQIDHQTTSQYSIITIVNWVTYQESDHQNDQQMTGKRPTDDQQMTTNKNDKNGKNEENDKNNIRQTDFLKNDYSDDFLEVAEEWFSHKKERKESYKGQRSIKGFCTRLKNLSKGSAETAQKIVNQSIDNNYAGVFKLKEDQNKPEEQSDLSKKVMAGYKFT